MNEFEPREDVDETRALEPLVDVAVVGALLLMFKIREIPAPTIHLTTTLYLLCPGLQRPRVPVSPIPQFLVPESA